MIGRFIGFVVAGIVLIAFLSIPDGHAQSPQQREFVGVAKCKTCHKKEEQGEQFRIWSEGPHAKAYKTLAGAKALEFGKERGIENPQTTAECLKCHVTAYGVDEKFLGTKHDMTDGVGCESCHGAGGDYYKKATMKKISAGEIEAASVGLIIPDEKVCTGCHNEESPGFKGFNFKEAYEKIAHPLPDSVRAKYQKNGG